MMCKKKPTRHAAEQGQVLLLAVVILFALILAAVMLFDLHNGLRSKIKVETAQQASALAGANWQATGLNLIGQINLIKACTLLNDDDSPIDVPADLLDEVANPQNKTEKDLLAQQRMRARMFTLSEMQSRLSFIVPLLGCLAIQQTAKQNGMPPNNRNLAYYSNQVLPLHDDRNRAIEGYHWHNPYSRLIAEIAGQGTPMRVNSRDSDIFSAMSDYIGSIRLLLSDGRLYSAIHADDYCYWQLMKLAKQGVQPTGEWWRCDYTPAPFVEESELLTIGVRFSAADITGLDATTSFVDNWQPPAERMEEKDLNTVTWCTYDSRWYPGAYDEEGYYETQKFWRRGYWLRNDIRKGLAYEGPFSAVDNYVGLPRLNRTHANNTLNAHQLKPGAGDAKNDRTLGWEQGYVTETIVGARGGNDGGVMGVVAKPLGYFNNGTSEDDSPISTSIILPVFHSATIIPSTMPYSLAMLAMGDTSLKRFLMWLSKTEELANPPDGTEGYLQALLKLQEPGYLTKIYNPNFPGADSLAGSEILFGDSYKYPSDPNGAGWLQHAWLGFTRITPYVMEPENETDPKKQTKRELVQDNVVTVVDHPKYVEYDGAVRTYYGTKKSGYHYYLTKGGKILTNEDIACGFARTPPGGGSLPSGSNHGPPRL